MAITGEHAMALDELFETFEFLKKRIEKHRKYLSQDETRTRQVLIDPLLKELGWDVGDPSVVELERRIVKGQAGGVLKKADYVLSHERAEVAVVEAKRLGLQLDDEVTTQASTYANINNIPWVIVTDGDQWRMHKVFQAGSIEDRTVMQFRVSEDDASKCALRSLALWRPNICDEDGPVEAVEPVLIGCDTKPPPPPPPPPDSTVLSKLEHKARMKLAGTLTFPDGSRTSVKDWRSLYVEVARHLQRSGAMSRANPPFSITAGNRYAVNYEPVHRDGSPFVNSTEIGGGLYLETNNSAPRSLEHAKSLIVRCGGDPASYQLSLDA